MSAPQGKLIALRSTIDLGTLLAWIREDFAAGRLNRMAWDSNAIENPRRGWNRAIWSWGGHVVGWREGDPIPPYSYLWDNLVATAIGITYQQLRERGMESPT